MSHMKNLRGATNHFTPSTPSYREGYDRIFGKKPPTTTSAESSSSSPCEHDWTNNDTRPDLGTWCSKCLEQKPCEHYYPSRNIGPGEGSISLKCSKCGYSLLEGK